jgi:NitT/TauT family transport system substrate-binding protein
MRPVHVSTRASASRLALGITSLALLVAACQATGTAATGQAPSGTSITVGVVPAVDNAPLRVAVNDGVFRQHGLNVTIKTYSSLGPEFQALKSGHIDIAAGDYVDFFYEQAIGQASLHLIADGYDATSGIMEVLTMPGSNVTTPSDLEGKTVATPPAQLIPPSGGSTSYAHDPVPFNLETLATESVLQSDGVSPATVTWRPTPVQDMIQELSSGQVKAILVTEPYVLQAESQLGAVEVLDSLSGETTSLPLSGYFSLASYNRTHATAVGAFQAALSTAQAASAMRGPVQAVLPSFTGMKAQQASMVTLGSYPTFLNVGQVQRVAELMYDSGMITNPLSVSGMLSG